jgi:acetate kinase
VGQRRGLSPHAGLPADPSVRILIANAGSSSLKLSLLDGDDTELWSRELDAPRSVVEPSAVADALSDLPSAPEAVAHRIVHGGERFRSAVRLDDEVLAALGELTALAPLHQPKSLAAVDAVSRALPGLPEVACFDTAFHSSMPAAAATYALPREWRDRYGVRRFGFHGLSHAYAAGRVRQLAPTARKVVTCHLGAGASLCAVLDGRSIDTTMGFTPLEGLTMATRSGSVDPGLLLWLQEQASLTSTDMADALEHDSGLLGLAGTPDMRELLDRDDPDASLALEVYVHRLRAGIAAMTAALDGLDVLVFTGGVGERSAAVRALACGGLGYLGVAIDSSLNEAVSGDADIAASSSSVAVLVVPAREDLEIARQARELLSRRRS